MRRIFAATIAVLALAAAPALAGQWYAGDLHVHTTYSHDSWGGPGDDEPTDPTEYYTLGNTVAEDFLVAKSRGLDYLAITDHNNVKAQTDSGWQLGGVLGIPAYENSLHGHGQMLGATRVYEKGDSGQVAVRAMEEALHKDGGLLQANHPTDPLWAYDYADKPVVGDGPSIPGVPVDTVEVWNLPWFYMAPFPSAGDHDSMLRFGEALLDRGAHVGFTGGSDNHYKATLEGQGPGQPTTWVYADDLSVKGILAGIRAGHTTISWQPPLQAGPRVYLEGKVDGAWTAMQGDTIAPGSPVRVHVTGAPGATVRIVGDHGANVLTATADSNDFTAEATPDAKLSYAYAKVYGEDQPELRQQICQTIPFIELDGQTDYCHNRAAMLALSSAIYFQPAKLPRLP
jgi:hypothetical protein